MREEYIYLDHYRTTPLKEEIFEKMKPYFNEHFWLPASFTSTGTEISEVIERSKKAILNAFGLRKGNVIFTSGGTLANNLVIHGLLRDADLQHTHLIASKVDHLSILKPYGYYKKKGTKVTLLNTDENGYVALDELRASLTRDTRLVAITYVNHTIGTVQNVKEIIDIVKNYNDKIMVLVDGCEAVNSVKIDLSQLDIDFLTLSGHKIYGPKGTGAVIARDAKNLKPVIFGFVETSPYTPGAENIPGIVGISESVKFAVENRERYVKHCSDIQHYLVDKMEKNISDIVLNGPKIGERAVDNVNYSIRYIEGESITLFLDFEDIVVATGSACASSDLKVNYILSAIGRDHEMAHGSIRLTLGWDNTKKQIDVFIDKLIPIVERLRKQSTINRVRVGG
ncbi:MAG: cysteine desulfurase [Thermotogae bacterium]|nr:cysteine desulfurase [Thermotogota bacterium]